MTGYEVSFKSSDLVFVFTDQACRHIFYTGVETEFLDNLVNLIAVDLCRLAILLDHLLLTYIFDRLNYCVQLLQSLLALDYFSEWIIVFGCFHSFNFESIWSIGL